jgi:hypothetical protein
VISESRRRCPGVSTRRKQRQHETLMMSRQPAKAAGHALACVAAAAASCHWVRYAGSPPSVGEHGRYLGMLAVADDDYKRVVDILRSHYLPQLATRDHTQLSLLVAADRAVLESSGEQRISGATSYSRPVLCMPSARRMLFWRHQSFERATREAYHQQTLGLVRRRTWTSG